ncbi:competence type IV pilus major pilin ComGC [Eubacterium barkeri]|uniref:N-terminal methylation site-containing protein n=1 Tax=Eubacterium barkeri TaxID=1528 RepID=A0A1H3D181_EUBBA|nr:prepilin-type N-terminal cleavage/methylation domain-containing protein [Eubacterium barkeri]SDX59544.1 N-terminal methylation site-containing protein [Eubacterium barkeri]
MKRVQGILKEKGGFTLAELVVVLAIIGLLAGIAVPVYSKALGAAQQKTDETNAAMVESAVQVYVADTGAMPGVTAASGTKEAFDEVVITLSTSGKEYLNMSSITSKNNNVFKYNSQTGKVTVEKAGANPTPTV